MGDRGLSGRRRQPAQACGLRCGHPAKRQPRQLHQLRSRPTQPHLPPLLTTGRGEGAKGATPRDVAAQATSLSLPLSLSPSAFKVGVEWCGISFAYSRTTFEEF